MADIPRKPVNRDDHFRIQDEPPRVSAGGGPEPRGGPGRRRRRARHDRDDAVPAKPLFGGWRIPGLKPRPMTVRDWLVLAGIAVPLLVVAVVMAVWQTRQQAATRAVFLANMASYVAPPKDLPANAPRPPVGKVVVVDADKRVLDEIYFQLPPDLRADGPADVTTVVQTRYTARQVGEYEDNHRALQLTCTVTVIDKASQALLGSATFTGPPPPPRVARRTVGEDIDGGAPVKEIIDYLRQLRKG